MKQNLQKNPVRVIFGEGFFCVTIYASGTERPFFEPQQVQICHSGGDALTFLAEVCLERAQKNRQRASGASSQYDKDSRPTGWILINTAAGAKWKTRRVSKSNQDVISGQLFFIKAENVKENVIFLIDLVTRWWCILLFLSCRACWCWPWDCGSGLTRRQWSSSQVIQPPTPTS